MEDLTRTGPGEAQMRTIAVAEAGASLSDPLSIESTALDFCVAEVFTDNRREHCSRC
jgi:hypothetical protein